MCRSRLTRGLILASLLATLFGLPGNVQAAFVGNPTPEATRFAFSHSIDFTVSQRALSSTRWTSPVTMESVRLLARESYGLVGWRGFLINVSGMFGVTRNGIDFGTVFLPPEFWDRYAPDTPHSAGRRSLFFGEASGVSAGAGLKVRLFEWKGMGMGGAVQLLYTEAKDVGQPSLRLRYNEWDTFFGMSFKRKFMGIYAGATASWLVGEMSTPDPFIATDLDQDTLVGAAAGFTM